MSNGYINDFFTPEAEAWIRARPKSDKPRHCARETDDMAQSPALPRSPAAENQ